MKFPLDKEFAFTIIDDTDAATVQNVKPIYDFLHKLNIKTTKTVWIYPPRDKFRGESLQDSNYLKFVKELDKRGFEIQLHNVGSGSFDRDDILKGLEIFKDKLGRYPSMQINHAKNPDNLYWGNKRFSIFLNFIIKLAKRKKREFYGDDIHSKYFWGDFAKKHIKYIRNRKFEDINTLKKDPKMPIREKNKKYANYFFSSTDGHNITIFNKTVTKESIDRLKKEKGICIIYTHFASGFLEKDGTINKEFQENMEYLSKQNGWYVPAGELLDYLLSKKEKDSYPTQWYLLKLDLQWIIDRAMKKIKFNK